MNVAGHLATVIFAITTMTVIGGLFAYGVYKARERSRARAAKAAPRNLRALEFFVEYTLPPPATDAAPSGASASRRSSRRVGFALAILALVAIAGTAAF